MLADERTSAVTPDRPFKFQSGQSAMLPAWTIWGSGVLLAALRWVLVSTETFRYPLFVEMVLQPVWLLYSANQLATSKEIKAAHREALEEKERAAAMSTGAAAVAATAAGVMTMRANMAARAIGPLQTQNANAARQLIRAKVERNRIAAIYAAGGGVVGSAATFFLTICVRCCSPRKAKSHSPLIAQRMTRAVSSPALSCHVEQAFSVCSDDAASSATAVTPIVSERMALPHSRSSPQIRPTSPRMRTKVDRGSCTPATPPSRQRGGGTYRRESPSEPDTEHILHAQQLRKGLDRLVHDENSPKMHTASDSRRQRSPDFRRAVS